MVRGGAGKEELGSDGGCMMDRESESSIDMVGRLKGHRLG